MPACCAPSSSRSSPFSARNWTAAALPAGRNPAAATSFPSIPCRAARPARWSFAAGPVSKFTPAGSTWPYGRDPQDSNIRIAPSFASAEEIEPAARLFTICVRLATLEKLAATRFASETALGAERIA
ncbi:MAG: hypothetical protein V8S19_04865 [Gemmiger qucibialis]